MNKDLEQKLNTYRASRHRKSLWQRIVSALATVTVFCTTYALMMPAVTMIGDDVAECGFEAHTHGPECWSEEIVLSLACEQEEHVHDESCRDEEGGLICTVPEHVHIDTCYQEVSRPIFTCAIPEHEHDMGCFPHALVEEGPEYFCGYHYEHAHDDSCFLDGVLICSLVEHTHTDRCLTDLCDDDSYHEHREAVLRELAVQELPDPESMTKDLNAAVLGSPASAAPMPRFALRSLGLDPVRQSFADLYGAYGYNGTQVDAGLDTDSAADYRIIYNSDGEPQARLKKTILPAGEENEFYISLVAEPIYTHDWEYILSNADIMLNNNKGGSDSPWVNTPYPFSVDTPIGTVISALSASPYNIKFGGNTSYLLDWDAIQTSGGVKTLTSDQSTAPASQRKAVEVMQLRIYTEDDGTNLGTAPIDMDVHKGFGMSTTSGISVIIASDKCKKTAATVSYDTSTKTLTFPYPVFKNLKDANLFDFTHMKSFSTVVSTEIGAVTDVLGDEFEFLGFESANCDGAPVISGDTIHWDLHDVMPYTGSSYEQVYLQSHNSTTGADDDYFAPVNAYRMVYKVRLKDQASGYHPGTVYPTNASATLYYTDSDGSPDNALFPVPSAHGLSGSLSFTKLGDDGVHPAAPLSGAVFQLRHDTSCCPVCAALELLHLPHLGTLSLPATSNSSGQISYSDLLSGHTYLLQETSAPAGYRRSENYLVTVALGTVSVIPADGTPDGNWTGSAGTYQLVDIAGEDPIEVELPSTGGTGVGPVYALGIGLMVVALHGLVLLRRRELF